TSTKAASEVGFEPTLVHIPPDSYFTDSKPEPVQIPTSPLPRVRSESGRRKPVRSDRSAIPHRHLAERLTVKLTPAFDPVADEPERHPEADDREQREEIHPPVVEAPREAEPLARPEPEEKPPLGEGMGRQGREEREDRDEIVDRGSVGRGRVP